MTNHIFISYSRKDIVFAQPIVTALAENDLNTWVDWNSIPKGEDWWNHIQQGIEEADAFLFLISPESVISEVCHDEIDHAVKNGKRILPVVIYDASPEKSHPEISKRNWIFCRAQHDNFDKAITEIFDTVHTDFRWLQYHRKLQVKALEWERTRDNSRLLRGKELREAEEKLSGLSAQKEPQPTQLQRNYVLVSQRDEIRQRRQLTIGLGLGLIIVVILSLVTWNQRNIAISEGNAKATALVNEEIARLTEQAEKERAEEQAQISHAGELAAQSIAAREVDLQLSLLLGIEAYQTYNTYQTQHVLLENIQTNSRLNQYVAIGSDFDLNYYSFKSTGSKILAFATQIENDYDERHKPICDLAFSPDETIIAVSSRDYQTNGVRDITFWDANTKNIIGEPIILESDCARSIVFSPDGEILAFVSDNSENITLWDVATQQIIGKPMVMDNSSILSITFSPDGNILAARDFDDTVILWDVETHKSIGEPLDGRTSAHPLGGQVGGRETVAFSPDGKILATCNIDNEIILWNVKTQERINQPLVGHTDTITWIKFSKDGKHLLSNSEFNSQILWNLYPQLPISQSLSIPIDFISSIALSPDGNVLAVGTDAPSIALFDLADNQIIQTLTGHTKYVSSIAFSPNGKLLASASADGSIILWDLGTNQSVGQFAQMLAGRVGSLLFSPDGQLLAVESRDLITIWYVASQEQVGNPITDPPSNSQNLAFTSDGKILAYASYGRVVLWDLQSELSIERPPLTDFSDAGNVIISPNGSTIISDTYGQIGASDDYIGSVIFWNIETGQSISQPRVGHTDIVNSLVTSLAISPGGNILASGSNNRAIILWDINTQQPIGQPLTGYGGIVNQVIFSPDKQKLISLHGSGSIVQWKIDPLTWVQATCQRVGRNLTQTEWHQYFPNEEYRITCLQYPAGY